MTCLRRASRCLRRVTHRCGRAGIMVPGDAVEKINAQLMAAGAKPLVADSIGVPTIANLVFHTLPNACECSEVDRVNGEKEIASRLHRRGRRQNQLLNRLTREIGTGSCSRFSGEHDDRQFRHSACRAGWGFELRASACRRTPWRGGRTASHRFPLPSRRRRGRRAAVPAAGRSPYLRTIVCLKSSAMRWIN